MQKALAWRMLDGGGRQLDAVALASAEGDGAQRAIAGPWVAGA